MSTDASGRRTYPADPQGMSDDDWRERLTAEQYEVTRGGGTEPSFTGKYHDHKGKGTYRCVCCGAPVFGSEAKYDSGSGWPSFWEPNEDELVEQRKDDSHGMVRTEARCAVCQAHLGHVFDDGPEPTGQRYCINSAALEFDPDTGAGDGGRDEATDGVDA